MIEKAKWYEEATRGFEQDSEYWAEGMKLEFAEEVIRLMSERKMSRADLARKLGTSPAYVTKILHWTANLTLVSMAKIALALDARVSLSLAPRYPIEQRPTMELQPRTAARRATTREVTLAREPVAPYLAKRRERATKR